MKAVRYAEILRFLLTGLLVAFLGGFKAEATHIVGGELSYEHVGGNTYRVTLIVYRDCGPTNTNDTYFDDFASIGIFQNGLLYDELFIALDFTQITEVPVVLENPCFVLPPEVCVEQAVYIEEIDLPPSLAGYSLVYQRCCRNPSIINILFPESSGATFTTQIPGTAQTTLPNSSPKFDNFPPVALCTNASFTFSHSATDPDGDELEYEFCTPMLGGTDFAPMPQPPAGPPFNFVAYETGFSADYPISSDPAFTIDSETGFIEGTPTVPGQYVIGICVNEYRDGVLLSRSNRDFQFNVVACDPTIIAAIPEQEQFCDGLEFNFSNSSTNATSFYWDFGDPFSDTDFSLDPTPSYTYSDTGYYTVTLIANPGWPCADTALTTYAAFPILQPVVIQSGSSCPDGQVLFDFEAGGQIEDENAVYLWNFGPFATPVGSDQFSPGQVALGPPGSHTVSLTVQAFGCTETATAEFEVPPYPLAILPEQELFCNGFTFDFINESLHANAYQWDFGVSGTSADVSDLFSPSYTYPDTGTYVVSLTAFSESGCFDQTSGSFAIQTLLDPYFDSPGPECFDGHSLDFEAQGSEYDGALITWDFGELADPSFSSSPSPQGVSYSEPGIYEVTLSISEHNCNRSYTDLVELVPNPEIGLEIEGDEGCRPLTVSFQNLSTSPNPLSYLWDFGDGQTTSQQNPQHTYNQPGNYDVRLSIQSAQGCVISMTLLEENAVFVYEDPIAGFSASPTSVSIFAPEITVTDQSEGSVACLYELGDGYFSPDCEFVYNYTEAGMFEIVQTVVNETGCEATASQWVLVEGYAFYAPNTFTPNGDGINEVFFPQMLGVSEYEIRIFNRWGELIFETKDQAEPWTGNVNGGEHYAPDGVYIYKVRIEDMLSYPYEFTGHVTLIR